MAYDSVPVLVGDPLQLRLDMTLDGSPWDDVADYEPRAQVRKAAGSMTVVGEFTITADGASLLLVLETADLDAGNYFTDVEFLDPDIEDPNLARFTWPGPGEDRLKLVVTSDVTR